MKTVSKDKDFLQGPIWNAMLLFVLPLVVTSIIQQLFNTADMAIAGQFLGKEAFAAIGSTATVSGFFIEFFLGFSNAANVVIARFIGMRDEQKAKAAVHTAVAVALLCGIVIAVVGCFTTRPLLLLLRVPTDILPFAELYLKIYFVGMPFFMLYNFCAAIFRSNGDAKKPLFCLSAGGAVKIALNLLFILVLEWGVAGFAVATVIANAVSAGLLLYFLTKKRDALRLDIWHLKVDKDILLSLIRIGLPSGFLGSVFSISNVCVQSAINSLGTDAVAAASAAAGIEIYIQFFGNAFAQAATTFTSQNYGAGNLERCKKVTRTALLLCNIVTVVLSVATFLCAGTLLKIFGAEGAVADMAITRMQYTLLFKFVQCIMDIMVGCLQGYGYTFVPAVLSIFGVCGLRLVWIFAVFPLYNTLEAIMVIYPITQAIASVSHFVCYCIVRRRIQRSAPGHE